MKHFKMKIIDFGKRCELSLYQDLLRFEFKIGGFNDYDNEQNLCIYVSLLFWSVEISFNTRKS